MNAALLFNIYQIGTLPVNADQLKQQSGQDPILAKVMNFILNGWPPTASSELKPFFNQRFEITIEAGCLMWRIRVIVPCRLREGVLTELHTGHPGIVKMKSVARTLVWRPGIDEALESLYKSATLVRVYATKQHQHCYIHGVGHLLHGIESMWTLQDPSWDSTF